MNRIAERIIGDYGDESAETLLICTAGLHGNEKAGVRALEKIFELLEEKTDQFQGRIVGIRGNLTALERDQRFINHDLNRIWNEEGQLPDLSGSSELAEKEELEKLLFELAAGSSDLTLVDLHTTSSESPPFAWEMGGKNVLLPGAPIPLIKDFMTRIPGTLAGFFSRRGYPVLCVEGGNHTDPESQRCLEDMIRLALYSTGVLMDEEFMESAKRHLLEITEGIPRELSVFHHHMIQPEDEFEMQPGYVNLQAVEKGALLAYDRNGPIHCPRDCRILLPLYQKQGEDGFLLADGV